MSEFDKEYIRLCKNVLEQGRPRYNERTGKNTIFYHGDMMKFELSNNTFPLLTTKKILTKAMVGELLGFIRAASNAKQFRDLGCNFWNANANESVDWLNNPNRTGADDLGRIYGVQARDWKTPAGESIDQLGSIIQKLNNRVDDRRLIVSHWNPGELKQMALPPCHLLYQFGLDGDYLNLCLYQRSADVPLGVPMNIASYSLLLYLVSKITGLKPGTFTHFLWDIHIYEDQLDGIYQQIDREPFSPPTININDNIKSLNDLETWVTPDDIKFENYIHHPAIKFPFAA